MEECPRILKQIVSKSNLKRKGWVIENHPDAKRGGEFCSRSCFYVRAPKARPAQATACTDSAFPTATLVQETPQLVAGTPPAFDGLPGDHIETLSGIETEVSRPGVSGRSATDGPSHGSPKDQEAAVLASSADTRPKTPDGDYNIQPGSGPEPGKAAAEAMEGTLDDAEIAEDGEGEDEGGQAAASEDLKDDPAVKAALEAVPEEFKVPPVLDEAARRKQFTNLEIYRSKMKSFGKGQAKPDMVAYKLLNEELCPERTYGHVPGIKIEDHFGGKGELAILGIHRRIMQGIDCLGRNPAFAVVLSGVYVDDKDAGSIFTYTGMGGVDPDTKQQAADQQWKLGNLSLLMNFEQKVPVRVARGSRTSEGELRYTYDGLYMVAKAYEEKGIEGFMMCKFLMVGIPGHHTAGQEVVFKYRSRFSTVRLGGRSGVSRSAAARAAELRALEKCVNADIACGRERVKIPVFNRFNEDEPEPFEYIPESVVASDEAQAKLDLMAGAGGEVPKCGLAHMGNKQAYSADGILAETKAYGVYECSDRCRSSDCAQNKLVTNGLGLGLEVFNTGTDCGWGVRCRDFIKGGTYVCDYVGHIITDVEADKLKGHDEYLMDMDYFFEMRAKHRKVTAGLDSWDSEGPIDLEQLPKLPEELHMHGACAGADMDADEDSDPDMVHMLTFDAKPAGNVARFINHSCNGNLITQVVMTQGCSAIRYRLALFAVRDIPPFTQLTYDYGPGYAEGKVPGAKSMACKCGAKNCRKFLA